LYRTPGAWLAAVFLFATAIFIYPRSRLHLFHIQVLGRRELGPGRERRLLSSGIRQHIRHPIYLAHLCMLLALTVGSGEIVL
jgi:protein-S-isoprenylcysteine O-methyltransferase Ste14